MNYRQTGKLFFVALCFTAVFGCKGQTGTGAKEEKKSGPVLAEVNGSTITGSDFNKEVEALPPYLKPMAETVKARRSCSIPWWSGSSFSSRRRRMVSTRVRLWPTSWKS
ncbi:hypothetical protein [Geotalea toluenoxydans]|uniref:hypothetical protein n=1 Tax=Geotalea toluenoxydans TaxID=421624 RepID=UPI001FB4F3A2|nr:hypothetical protein [Geotalea toluenoxydans]